MGTGAKSNTRVTTTEFAGSSEVVAADRVVETSNVVETSKVPETPNVEVLDSRRARAESAKRSIDRASASDPSDAPRRPEAGRRSASRRQEIAYRETTGGVIDGDAAWMDQALCRGRPIQMFYPVSDRDAGAAQAICGECPVRAQCLSYAIETDERWGIWGGLTEQERRSLQRRQRRTA